MTTTRVAVAMEMCDGNVITALASLFAQDIIVIVVTVIVVVAVVIIVVRELHGFDEIAEQHLTPAR